MAKTATELYDAVCDAIYALIVKGVAEYRIDGVAYTYNDIDALRRLRGDLQIEASRASGARPMILHADVSRRAR